MIGIGSARTVEAPYGVIWGLDGAQMRPWQAADRLYAAGFKDPILLAEACAVMRAESGWYLRAWHINAKYDADGKLVRDSEGRFTPESVDLGWVQRNVRVSGVTLSETDVPIWIADMFGAHPDLANGYESAKIARQLYVGGGNDFGAWYAWLNGLHRRYLDDGALAVGNLAALRNGQGGFALVKAPADLLAPPEDHTIS